MKLYLEGTDEKLNKKFETVDEIKAAIESKQVFESRALMCDCDHNLHFDLGIMRGIMFKNECAYGMIEGITRDIAIISRVNRMVCFRIVGFHRDVNGEIVAVLSRRSVQLDVVKELDKLNLGDVIDARVTHLESFGAFIDVGAGVNSLIPIDMLSVSRISSPSERLYEGEIIRTVLRKRDSNKLTFSLKELLGTWLENATLFNAGETVTGVVRSIESYGVFIELMPNLAGLAEVCDGLTVGQNVSVYIKSILPSKMKIKLIIVEKFEDIANTGELIYFIDDKHITEWNYSPADSQKQIQTRFE